MLPQLSKGSDTKAAGKKTDKQTRKQRLKEEGAAFVEKELELLAEYQTLRRMRRAPSFILFTVRTYISPFANLKQAPGNVSPNKMLHEQCKNMVKSKRSFHSLVAASDCG